MFGHFIKHYRERFGYTQSELVSKIQSFNKSFASLDEITLSRWENGHTTPVKKKQVLLLSFFGRLNDYNELYANEVIKNGKLDKLISKRYRNNFSESDSPYCCCRGKPIIVRSYSKIPDERLNFYIDILRDVHKIEPELEKFKNLMFHVEHTRLFEFYSSSGSLLGHNLYIIVDTNWINESLKQKVNTNYNFFENSSIYIISSYASNKDIFLYQLKIVFDALFSVSPMPQNIFVKCFFPEMIAYYEALGGEVVLKGPLNESGIKFDDKKYQWILYKINIIDMLSSKIFYVDQKVVNEKFIIENHIVD